MRRLLVAAVLLASAACFPRATIPDEDRQRVSSDFRSQHRFLRVALWSGVFFGDREKLLLADQPFPELDLLESPDGKPIPPPQPEKVLPPGTAVKIKEIEFPTGFLIAQRVVMTPRYHPWIYLEVEHDERTFVMVLPQTLKSYDDAKAEIDKFLSTDNPRAQLDSLPTAQKDAVLKKAVVEGMSPQAIEMAWGFPERKRVDRPAHSEEWIWPGGKRHAYLQDDKLTRWEPK
jgi:hypothetical protein